MPSTRKPKKKAPRRASRSAPWHQALEQEIVTKVIQPTLAHILQAGVQSRRDLHAQWQATTGCTVSSETFSRWLHVTGYDALFSQVRLVTTPSNFSTSQPNTQPVNWLEKEKLYLSPPKERGGPWCAFHKMPYRHADHQPTQECLVNEDGVPENEKTGFVPPEERGLTMDQLAGKFPLPVTEGRGSTSIPTFNAGVI